MGGWYPSDFCGLTLQLFWSRSRIVAHLLRTQNAATRAQQKGYKSRKEPKMTDVKI
jgi:hypothetical protein